MKHFIFFVLLFCDLAAASWYNIRTEHFIIHYRPGYEKTAMEVFIHCETIYSNITRFLDVEFPDKSHILIDPDPRTVNAFNTGVPRNLTIIYPNPPHQELSLSSLGGSWLYHLLLHELVHNIHLNRREKFIGFLSRILGPRFAEFWKNPDPWNKEGLAVFLESRLSPSGRGRLTSGHLHNLALYQAMTDTFPSVFKVNKEPGIWLMGSAYYIYGPLFSEYLYETYGEEKFRDFIKRSTSLFPLLKDVPFYRIYGKWPPEIWEEFRESYRKKAETLGRHEVENRLKAMTDTPAEGGPIKVTGGRILYVHFSHLDSTELREADPLSGESRVLVKFSPRYLNPAIIRTSGENVCLLMTRRVGTRRQYRDIYSFAEGKVERLTDCGNLIKAEYMDSIDCFLAMGMENDTAVFYLIDGNGRILNTRTCPGGKTRIIDYSVTSDGTITAFNIDDGSSRDIYLSYYIYSNSLKPEALSNNSRRPVNLRRLIRITEDGREKNCLFFSAANNLYYSAMDESGVSQLYMYDGVSSIAMTSGAFSVNWPHVENSNLYYWQAYRTGYRLNAIRLSERSNSSTIPFRFMRPLVYTEQSNSLPQVRRTRRLTAALPFYRYPMVSGLIERDHNDPDNNKFYFILGFSMGGMNIQRDFFYDTGVSWSFYDSLLEYNASMGRSFDRSFARVSFSHQIQSNNSRFITASGQMSHPFYTSLGSLSLYYAWTFSSLTNIARNGPLAGVSIGNARQVMLNSFPISGYHANASFGLSDRYLGADLSYVYLQSDLHLYRRLARKLNMHIHGAGGITFGPDKQSYFIFDNSHRLSPHWLRRVDIFQLPGSSGLDQRWTGRTFPVRVLGESAAPLKLRGLFASSLDFFIPIFEFYSVTKFFPWFMFHNITLDLFYDMVYFHTDRDFIVHGPGLAFDFRFAVRSKINLGLSYQFNRRYYDGFYYFINFVF